MDNGSRGIAKELYGKGGKVVPLRPESKAPVERDWVSKHHTAVSLDRFYVGAVQYGVGLMTGHEIAPGSLWRIMMLDVDCMDEAVSDAIRLKLEKQWGKFSYRIGQPPKFSVPFIMHDQDGTGYDYKKITSRVFFREGIKCQLEVLGMGQQSVIFGIHDKTHLPYEWHRGELWHTDFMDLPQVTSVRALRGMIADAEDEMFARGFTTTSKFGAGGPGSSGGGSSGAGTGRNGRDSRVDMSIDQCRDMLDVLIQRYPDYVEDYMQWLQVGMALHHQYGGSDEALKLWDEWSKAGSNYSDGVCAAKWKTFDIGDGSFTIKSLLFIPEVGRWWRQNNEQAGRRQGNELVRGASGGGGNGGQGGGGGGDVEPEREHEDTGLVLNNNDVPIANAYNIAVILRTSPLWAGLLIDNTFSCRTLLTRAIPGSPEPASRFPRDIADTDFTAGQAWFNTQDGFARVAKNLVADGMTREAARNTVSPVADYLKGLVWDGVERVSSWLTVYCGVDKSEYSSVVGKCVLISSVARMLEPGCQVDTMLILEGPQGAGKSSVIKALCGDKQYFGDNIPQLNSKDANDYVRGKWIIEMSELSAMSKHDVESTKSYISRSVEKFRPAYREHEITYRRQCIFIGTTNKEAYFRDETGNRRFWPVAIGKIDVAGVVRDRDQLWAEAVSLYQKGEPWWFDESSTAGKAATQAQQDRYSATWYEELIEESIEQNVHPFSKPLILEEDILHHVRTSENGRWVSKNAIKPALMKAGFARARAKTTISVEKFGRYVWYRDPIYATMNPRELADTVKALYPEKKFGQ
jgi:hypothetical protein